MMLALQCQCLCHDGACVWGSSHGCASWAVKLCVCENSNCWLAGCMGFVTDHSRRRHPGPPPPPIALLCCRFLPPLPPTSLGSLAGVCGPPPAPPPPPPPAFPLASPPSDLLAAAVPSLRLEFR